ncbi:MAG TPA: isoaspartyl peptidase/L-asparaginase [Solirubrobacteraceae bacterium]|jgi:isoaspartyl peptidase/L-asparaginase-like protein (Ntn-hydrolase superfamily)|nr:isoaspartyl peptidase/L-asparaginase [Solirubrobacteraceae bacterium]
MDEIAIVVHGGAGSLARDPERVDRIRAGAAAAVAAGHAVLAAGGPAVGAVEAAVVVLEDDPEFNAGRGAALTEYGRVELDASMMEGTTRRAGAVAAVRGVRNPIRAARAVLEENRHVLLVGAPATDFAATAGLQFESETWFVTERERRALTAAGAAGARGTVGAVARDVNGCLAAATSTGGVSGQRLGRVGDSPLVGAGTWADDDTVAVSCTGHGESIIRSALAHEVDALLRHRGLGLQGACARAIEGLGRWGEDGGLIAVSAHGEVAATFNSAAMTRAWRVGEGPVFAAHGPGEPE